MKSLAILEDNVNVLLAQYRDLQQQLLDLQQKNQSQREEIMRSHAELVKLRAEYNHLETAYALLAENTDGEQRDRVRQRITNLIAQVDRALEALKQ
jgi:peptidoglycan hydrolase CwlO-like protein